MKIELTEKGEWICTIIGRETVLQRLRGLYFEGESNIVNGKIED